MNIWTLLVYLAAGLALLWTTWEMVMPGRWRWASIIAVVFAWPVMILLNIGTVLLDNWSRKKEMAEPYFIEETRPTVKVLEDQANSKPFDYKDE